VNGAGPRALRVLRAAALAVALAASTVAPARAGPSFGPPRPGAVGATFIPAATLGDARRSVLVYLPPSYDRPEARDRRYPLVVFLHGGPGANTDFEAKGHIGALLDRLIARQAIPEIIALFPDGHGRGRLGRSLYVNSADGHVRMEDFLVHDLEAWADSTWRTRADAGQRALVGISDGGGAALNLAFKHPDRFRACAGLSGEYHLPVGRGVDAVLGPPAVAARIIAANSPIDYIARVAPAVRGMRIYMDCGLLDLSFFDDREMEHALRGLGLAHQYVEYWGWHDWPFWTRRLPIALAAVTRGWN